MMDNSYPVKLKLLRLEMDQPLQEDIACEFAMTKGTQHYGAIPFSLQKKSTALQFQNKTINFSYVPRAANRRDILFKISLIEKYNSQLIGDLEISTFELMEKFSADRTQVIHKRQEITEGAYLTYEISQPKIDIVKSDQKLGFKKVQPHDFLNSIFARPDSKPARRKAVPLPSQPVVQTVLPFLATFLNSKKDEKNMQTPEKNPNQEFTALEEKAKLVKRGSIDMAALFGNLGMNKTPESESKDNEGDLKVQSTNSLRAQDGLLMSGVFNFLRDSKHQEQKKKHTLIPVQHDDHHGHKTLSIKLRVVIFLLILGFLMLFVDTIQDREIKVAVEKKTPAKVKKAAKNKKKATH